MNLHKFKLLFTIFLMFSLAFGAEELEFNTLEISAKKLSDDKKAYLKPGAITIEV